MSKKVFDASEIAESILKSPKYRAIAPDAVRRIAAEECAKGGADIEKRARNRLHQIADAFMSQRDQSMLRGFLDEGDIDGALNSHASTRERMSARDEYMAIIGRNCPAGGTIIDAACGLNPLMLGAAGYRVRGLDIQMTAVKAINDWAQKSGWDISAENADLLSAEKLPAGDLTLLMKLLPVLDAQKAGEGMRLLNKAQSPRVLISFPTRTLSGRGVGMERNYGSKLENAIDGKFTIIERTVTGNELFYVLGRV